MLENITHRPENFFTFTSAKNAKILFSVIPTFEFLTQTFDLPAITTPNVNLNTRTGNFTRPGEFMNFEKPMQLEIVLDEHLISYFEIFNWIKSYSNIDDNVERDFTKIVSDATIIMLDNNGKEIGGFQFYNVYPIGMSGIKFDTTETSFRYVKFNAVFDYSHFEPVKVGTEKCRV